MLGRKKREKKDFRVAVGAEPADRGISPLRPDLRISPQLFYGQLCFVVKDPVTLRYFRLQPVEHFLVTQFDGARTARDLLGLLHQQFPECTLNVQDVLRFVGMLHEAHLLIGQGIAHSEWLGKRAGVSRNRKFKEAMQAFFFAKIPLFNPEKLLTAMENSIGKIIFNYFTGFLAILLCLYAVAQVCANTDRFQASHMYNLFDFQNILLFYVVFVVTKVFHEFGHGLAAKHFGGEVSQMGVMLFIFTPSFYCDTSDAWMIPSRAARLWINAGGIIIELVLAAIASFVWLYTPTETFLHQIALNTMISCSIATIFFNANPLLKYDGYYFLADLLEIPNLFTKGRQFIGYYAQKYILGLKPQMPPDRRRLGWLISYALISSIYRWFVFFGVTTVLYLLCANYGLAPFGIMLVVLYIVMTIVIPTTKGIVFLWKQRWDIYRRLAWVSAAGGLCVGALSLVALLPWDHTISAPLVIKPDQPENNAAIDGAGERILTAQHRGVIRNVFFEIGQPVKAGQIIAIMESPSLQSELEISRAQKRELEARRAVFMSKGEVDSVSPLDESLKRLDERIAEKQKELAELTIIAPFDGTIDKSSARGPDKLRELIGIHAVVGREICKVVKPLQLEAALPIPQSQASRIKEGMTVQIRLWNDPANLITAKVTRINPQLTTKVVHPALAAQMKSEISTTPNDRGEFPFTTPHCTIYVQLPPQKSANPNNFLAEGLTGKAEIIVNHTNVYSYIWQLILDSTNSDMQFIMGSGKKS
jgi:putative peptide zinc metalloprotease protein